MKNYLQDNYQENITHDRVQVVVKTSWENVE